MCRHPASTIIRTRVLRRAGCTERTGFGRLHVIEYVKQIQNNTFQGTYSDGSHWYITAEEIESHPNFYRLRKEHDHRNCFQLVITRIEKYRKVEAIESLLGPKQSARCGVSKTRYHLFKGREITDRALKRDRGVDSYQIVSTKTDSAGFKSNETNELYLRETFAKGVNEEDEDTITDRSSRPLVQKDVGSPHDSTVEMEGGLE